MSQKLSVVLLNKKYIHSYLMCIVYDKLLKPPTIILNNPVFSVQLIVCK